MTAITKKTSISGSDNILLLCSEKTNLTNFGLTKPEADFVKNEISKNEKKFLTINQLKRYVFIQIIEQKKEANLTLEANRKAGSHFTKMLNKFKIADVTLVDTENNFSETLAFAEGVALANYQFLKYKKDLKKETHSLKNIFLKSDKISAKNIEELQIVIDATCKARTLINEPVIYLTAVQMAKEFEKMGKEAGFKVEVFNKAKITALKMGGLLAVNAGSLEPPTFSIMEWKPKNAKNKKPYVLVGKGVVYDTGGLSLKPTANSMDMMKCDMSGGAAVAGTLYAAAKAKLPVHIIGIVPATDNRPGVNAYTPGDVITMHSGLTVEVLNTDAEGRMILADALSYAQKYKPELVIDLATLTGAAAAAIGKYGMVAMGTADEKKFSALKKSGNNVHERLVEFPFWDDYDELIKSTVAEIKNIGGPHAGSITAGKFLAHFIDYPWIHLDIAGPAFLTAEDTYKPQGGTGVGVRLLFDFFKNM
ncbi:MAG TPA: leucyl aminopeptidase [Bacteroidia bacterium]|nr:leucyl aminopeptidase [Bacteroidia bacterium]